MNLPAIGAGALAGSHRLAHMHRNVPGVLATVNALFAEHGVNVEAQNLSTRGDVGYLVTDVNADYTPDIVERLRADARDDPVARAVLIGLGHRPNPWNGGEFRAHPVTREHWRSAPCMA